MNTRLAFALLLSFLLGCTLPGYCLATMQQDIDSILSQINQHQGEQAYALAQQVSEQYEGDSNFDFAYGLAAQASRHYDQAVFAFERVVKNNPAWLQARYALATSYFASGNINAADAEFKQLAATDSAKLFPKLNDYLSAIEQKRQQHEGHWQHQMQLGLGSDSNANSGVDAEVINIPLFGNVQLFDGSRAIDDNFWQAEWRSSYIQPINQQSSWYGIANVKYAGYQQHHDMSRLYGDLFAGWQSKIDQYKYHVNAFYRPLWLDNDKYLDYAGITGDVSHNWGLQGKLGISLLAAKLNFQQDDLDKNQWSLSPWLSWDNQQVLQKFMLNYGQENADDKLFDHLSRDFYGASYHLLKQFNQSIRAGLTLNYTKSNYQRAHPLFASKQHDSLWKLSANYQQALSKSWLWLVQLDYLYNSSNLTLYDYHRTLLSTSVQYQF